MSETLPVSRAKLMVGNIGGIESSEIECSPGVSVLTGRNATNRTSVLQALMAALGSDDATLRANAEEGTVELTIGDETYTRTLTRSGDTVRFEGDPYLEDPTFADLFAFLLESNETRRAVETDDDLREVIMRPVDTAAIEAEIERLESDRDEIDTKIDELDTLNQRLPELEERRVAIESDIEDKREELEEKRAEIEGFDADVDETREEQAELEAALEELREVRGELERKRDRLESERESIEALKEEREEVEAALGELSKVPTERIDRIDEEIQQRRGKVQAIESTIADLQPIIKFNQDTLEGGRSEIVAKLDDVDKGSPTDELVTGDETVCWTCGRTVDTDQIETTLGRLRDLHQQKNRDRQSLREEISDLQDERDELDAQRDRREDLQRKLREFDEEIEQREEHLETLTAECEDLSVEVDTLEAEVQNEQSEQYGEILDLHADANQLEFELQRLEEDLEDVIDEIDRIEARLEVRDQLEAQREELDAELSSLRTRIDDLETAAVEEFNDHMDTILDRLEYANIERIWIERTERDEREGRRNVARSHFDLHVVRSTADGAVFEDTVDHLSESEREVTGLVFALAGYLAHEVYETVPFMLLDSVEAIDADRIASLIEYLSEFADYLVVALLPEDAAALDDSYERITEI